MNTADITPEVRKSILDSMSKTSELFLRDLMRGFFEQPNTSFAKQLTLEAFATALIRTLGTQVMQTFIYELQDLINKEAP